jgi:small subunit ribosomal protein S18
VSEETKDTSTGAATRPTPPSGPAAGGDSATRPPRTGPSGPPSSGGGDRGGYGGGDRGGRPSRDRDDRPPRAPLTVKGRLRAAARKKARKSAKKKGMFQRRKVCRFCADKNLTMSYKDVKTLRLFITETGKMTPRRISGTCAKHQRPLAQEIKRARQLAMLPYAPSHF